MPTCVATALQCSVQVIELTRHSWSHKRVFVKTVSGRAAAIDPIHWPHRGVPTRQDAHTRKTIVLLSLLSAWHISLTTARAPHGTTGRPFQAESIIDLPYSILCNDPDQEPYRALKLVSLSTCANTPRSSTPVVICVIQCAPGVGLHIVAIKGTGR